MTLFHKLTFGFGLLFAAPIFASTITVDFGKPDAATFTQGSSTTATYTFAPGDQIFATGYHVNSLFNYSLTPLYAKTDGGDEEGLGLAGTNGGSSHEITPQNFIQLDLHELIPFGATSFKVKTNSTTGEDAFYLFLSSTKGSLGSFYTSGDTETTYTFTAAQLAATSYVSLYATSGDVLLGPGTITASAPEPGTLLSLGAGLVLVGLRWRRATRS